MFNMSTEINIGGIKFTGGKMFAALTALSSAAGIVWGAALLWDDYEGHKKKLSNLDPDGIAVQVETSMIKVEEAISYAKDIKQDLRTDVINVENALEDVHKAIREVENRNRVAVSEAKRWFDEKLSIVETQGQLAEANNRKVMQDFQQWFDEKIDKVDQKSQAFEEDHLKSVQDFQRWFDERVQTYEDRSNAQLDKARATLSNAQELFDARVIAINESLLESEQRTKQTVTDAQKWFDERVVSTESRLKEVEERMNKRIDRALTNILADQ